MSSTASFFPSKTSVSPLRRKAMSITQTYYLAHTARGKLSREAAQPDHNLRLLVGHANLLDSLMLELAEAEREQESWFNQSVRGATKHESAQDRHIQWADTVIEEPEQDWQAEDADSDSSDSESEYDEDDFDMADAIPLRRVASHTAIPVLKASDAALLDEDSEDDEEYEDDGAEDYASLSLTLTKSHSASSPPELEHDSDSSEDESMPPSPPAATPMPTFAKHGALYEEDDDAEDSEEESAESDKKAFYNNGFYVPPRNPARGLVSTISVY